MIAHSIKTDNANVGKKVNLRKQATAHFKELRVLDLFAGGNVLWSHFKCDRYFGVEKEKNKGCNLSADNMRVIESLDLSGFNCIDVDSYGIPYNQICKVFSNRTLQKGTVIIYTLITNKMSGLNKSCIDEFGLQNMYKKCRTLFAGKARELFYAMLYKNNINSTFYYTAHSSFYKEYGYFIV